MRIKAIVVSLALIFFTTGSVSAQPYPPYGPEDLRYALMDISHAIEFLVKEGYPTTIDSIMAIDPLTLEQIFNATGNKARFIESARIILNRSNRHIPPDTNIYANYLVGLGIIAAPDQRCDKGLLTHYEYARIGTQELVEITKKMCEAANCRPAGPNCEIACNTHTLMQAVHALVSLPIRMATVHEANLDTLAVAEIYQNSQILLNTLNQQNTGLLQRLTQQDAALADISRHMATHDSEIKALLTTSQSKQDQMILMLKKLIKD